MKAVAIHGQPELLVGEAAADYGDQRCRREGGGQTPSGIAGTPGPGVVRAGVGAVELEGASSADVGATGRGQASPWSWR